MNMENDRILEAAVRITPQWLAGFFDGEGCVSVVLDRYKRPYLRCFLTQTDVQILVLINIKYGGNLQDHKSKNTDGYKRRPGHRLFWFGIDARLFLHVIKDHVICKKRQVELALELEKATPERGREIMEELCVAKRQGLWEPETFSQEGGVS